MLKERSLNKLYINARHTLEAPQESGFGLSIRRSMTSAANCRRTSRQRLNTWSPASCMGFSWSGSARSGAPDAAVSKWSPQPVRETVRWRRDGRSGSRDAPTADVILGVVREAWIEILRPTGRDFTARYPWTTRHARHALVTSAYLLVSSMISRAGDHRPNGSCMPDFRPAAHGSADQRVVDVVRSGDTADTWQKMSMALCSVLLANRSPT